MNLIKRQQHIVVLCCQFGEIKLTHYVAKFRAVIRRRWSVKLQCNLLEITDSFVAPFPENAGE